VLANLAHCKEEKIGKWKNKKAALVETLELPPSTPHHSNFLMIFV
jgi:hypothetical protein